ncbi:MAG: DUF4124 domain-containing protein [Pseudomonadota bacterium]
MLCLLPAAASHAQVYRVVDENGNVTFTDKPPPDAEKIDVRAPNTSAPPVTSAFPKSNSSTADPEGDAEAEGGYRVTITAPSDETVIPRGAGNFTVSASVVPSPQSGEQFQLLVDGAAHLDPQPGTSWSLTNVSRGEHSIAVAVVDGSGARISTSDSIKVYVYRPSLNDAVNNPPPRPTPRLGLPRSN